MKQVSTTKNSLVLSSPLHHSIYQRSQFSKYRFIILFAVIVLFISSCHKEDNHKKTVPLIAVFQTKAKIVKPNTDVLPELDLVTAMGDGTPIGKSTFVGHAQYYPPDFNLTGNGVITTANGDQIFATVNEPGPVIEFKTGNIVLTCRATITDGTGRFTGATGGWTTIAHANINTPTGIDSLKGTITYR